MPFAAQDLGFNGVVPGGWSRMAPGQFASGQSRSDRTVLLSEAFSDRTTNDVVEIGSDEFGSEVRP